MNYAHTRAHTKCPDILNKSYTRVILIHIICGRYIGVSWILQSPQPHHWTQQWKIKIKIKLLPVISLYIFQSFDIHCQCSFNTTHYTSILIGLRACILQLKFIWLTFSSVQFNRINAVTVRQSSSTTEKKYFVLFFTQFLWIFIFVFYFVSTHFELLSLTKRNSFLLRVVCWDVSSNAISSML